MKLIDFLEVSDSDVSIMKGVFPTLTIFSTRSNSKVLSDHMLNSEIERVDNYDNRIRVWLKNEVKNKKK